MTVAAALPLSTESFNRIMIRITENFDPVIRKKLRETPSIYRNIQAAGTFKLGEGYIRKVHTFYPGDSDQAADQEAIGIVSPHEAEECSHQHHPFQAQVEDTGPLADDFPQRDQNDRGGLSQSRLK